ncbi:EF-hand calcium-binding domain-containing protein 6 [Schistosoma japonicum]|uniref:EF-hand calcium-binding domain-containing protein 6 n=1 Tax=Schistosoma japonicum TaxID=6182 RepID=A0A4Z2D3C2_SCHJA|nr:EF-hand calcium-binding domain-containing protein 6 [Schistosoma japonicum]
MNLKSSNNNDNNELQSNDALIAIKDNKVTSSTIDQQQFTSVKSIIPNLMKLFTKGYRRICKTIEYCTKQYINKQHEDNQHSIKNLPKGYTIADVFLSTLTYLNLPLIQRIQIGQFFTRYGLMITQNNLLPYGELFRRFQDRTEAGVLHQMLTDTLMTKRKSFKNDENENILQLEHELIRRFHGDFLHLLNTLRNFDLQRSGVVSPETFRIILYNHYGYEFTTESFNEFLNYLPLDFNGNVKYTEFMRQFNLKSEICKSTLKNESNDQCQTENFNSSFVVNNNDKSIDSTESNSINRKKTPPVTITQQRTLNELKQLIHETLKLNIHEIEKRFYELDEMNSGCLNQEQLYQLLKGFNIQPEISRGEIRKLWPEFFIDQRHCLSFHEFIRYFLYCKLDAAYPNAKISPPRLGDTDLMRLSNKLNGVSCLIKDSLRAKIDFMFDRLYNEFLEMDPKGTGYITPRQLTSVLRELCLQVSNREIDDLIKKFDIHKDGKISYLALLQPFIRKRLLKFNVLDNKLAIHNLTNKIIGIDEVNKLQLSTLLPILNEIQPKVPISRLNWNKMHRSMKQVDPTNCGRLNVTVFKDLYEKGTGIHLTDEQLYHLLTILDPHISNTLPYTHLLEVIQSQVFNNENQTKRLNVEDKGDNFNKELNQQQQRHEQEKTLNVD